MAKTIFVPFGELKPDGKQFVSDGLVDALGVVPVYGNYVTAQIWDEGGDEPVDEAYGLHVHFAGGSTYYLYMGSITKLYEYNSSFVKTDKTRAVGGNYATSGAGGEAGWQGTSFGDAIIMTQYVDDPQLLTSPSAANFVKLATSAGGSSGTGMDPKAKFIAPVRANLFLGNLNLPSALIKPDGVTELAAGVYPTYVCWSRSDNVRQYGSALATPDFTGCGYQPLAYDFGHINGMIGGEYALISLQRGWVRGDGPPYTFRPIVEGHGCRYPNSIVRLDSDVYYWGPAGPTVLRGGEGPPVVLGDGRIARTLIDNATGFSPTYSVYSSIAVRHISAGADATNGLVYWSFTTNANSASRIGDLAVIYNAREDRFSFADNGAIVTSDGGPFNTGILFLQSRPDLGGSWAPGRDLVGVMKYVDFGLGVHYQLAVPSYTAAVPPAQWGGSVPTLTNAFQQFDPELTTRVLRVRLIFSRSGSSTITVTAKVTSKNRPYDSATTKSYTTLDAHGWIPIPDSTFADFHQIGFTLSGTQTQEVGELEGYEVEVATGGRYSA